MNPPRFPAEHFRPGELSEVKDAFLRALDANDGRYTDALKAAQVSDSQVRAWKEHDPYFADAYELSQERRRDKTRRVVHEMIDDKEPTIVAKAMSALPEFAKKASVTVTGSVDHNHHIANASREELAKLIDLGAKAIELERKEDGTYEGR